LRIKKNKIMARGRKLGEIELSIDELMIIIEMTLSKTQYTRTDIAKKINRAKSTVLRYQKYLGLL